MSFGECSKLFSALQLVCEEVSQLGVGMGDGGGGGRNSHPTCTHMNQCVPLEWGFGLLCQLQSGAALENP